MKNTKTSMSSTMSKLGALVVMGVTLMLGGCAINSVDQYGNDCVVGQTCPGLLTRPITDKVIENMDVIGVHKPGSKLWNDAIRTEALRQQMTEEAVRALVGDKDFVQARKMGFMYAVNKHAGLYASGLKVGDVIDVAATSNPLDIHVARIVKRAGD